MDTAILYTYRFKITRVIDGDTVEGEVDLGFTVKMKMRLRLADINAPEMRGGQREAGVAARDHLIALVNRHDPIYIRTQKDKSDSFGRYVATLFGYDDRGISWDINAQMVDDGHAERKSYSMGEGE